MSEAKTSGGASIQELIDRYNNELMQYQRKAAETTASQQTVQASAQANKERDEAYEQGMREREQGLKDLRQGLLDAAQGEREADEGRAEREYWLQQDSLSNAQRDNVQKASVKAAENSSAAGGDQTAWRDEVSDGLDELRAGLIELAKGLAELKNGLQELSAAVNNNSAGTCPYAPPAETQAVQNREGETLRRADKTAAAKDGDVGAVYTGDPVGECCGYLQVAVFTAHQAMPIVGALVTVSRMTSKGEVLYATSRTGQSGKTPDMELPAAQPNENFFTPPYVDYRVRVSVDGYYSQNDLSAKVFRDVTATLPVELIPLPANGR